MQSLVKNTELRRVANAAAAGQTDVNSSSIKMDDCEGVRFDAALGAVAAGGTPALKLQQSDDDGAADAWSDLEGSLAQGADTDSNKVLSSEVYRPTKLYVRAVLTRGGGANTTVDAITATKYRMRVVPTERHSTVAAQTTVVGPDEGTP